MNGFALATLVNDIDRIPEMRKCKMDRPEGYLRSVEIIVSEAEGRDVTIGEILCCLERHRHDCEKGSLSG